MFFLYSILLALGFLAYLPRFLFRSKYRASLGERLGNLPDFDAGGKPVAWLHCVSVGEVQAARPLVGQLLENFPDYKLVISTTTPTGQQLAREIFAPQAALVFYFPFDFKFAVRRSLRRISPVVVLLMETELWFNFIREAGQSGAQVAVVNGRLSEKSAERYGRISRTMRRVLRHVDTALMQTNADAKRLLSLGIRNTKIKVTGSIKFDLDFGADENDLTAAFRERFAVSEEAPLVIAASTHAPEERLVLEAFKTVYKSTAGGERLPRLMLVPRHPERFAEVESLVRESGFDWVRRTEAPSARDRAAEIILLDSIGELRAALPLAEIVFMGGSLIPHGGQNPLEPAAAQKAIVTGFYTMNFAEIIGQLLAKDAIIQLPEADEARASSELAGVFGGLLRDDGRRAALAKNAFQVVKQNRGATARTVEHLKPIFEAQKEWFLNRKRLAESGEPPAPPQWKKRKYYKKSSAE